MSLRLRVALATFVTTAVVVALVGVALIALVGRDERNDLDDRLAQQAQVVAQRAAVFDNGRDRAIDEIPAERLVPNLNAVGRLRDAGGTLTLGDYPLPEDEPAPLGYSTVDVDGETWRVYALTLGEAAPRVATARGLEDAVVEVASPTDELDTRITTLRRQATRLGLLGMAVAFGAGFVLGGTALRPLARLRRDTERITDPGAADERVAEDQGLPEVDDLARSMNLLLERIAEANLETEAALEASRSFAANAAHELRTPLTSMQANLDVLGRNPDLAVDEREIVLADVRRQQERLLHLLDGLRLLARGDLAGALPTDEVDLVQLVDEAVVTARRRHPDAEIELTTTSEVAGLHGWREGLRVLVGNLVDNAAKHGRANDAPATIHVDLAARPDALTLTVDDAGPGIPADQRDLVVSRFGRGSTSSEGSGLGLALAVQQAALHGGTLTLDDAPGGGLRVVVHLPLPGSSPAGPAAGAEPGSPAPDGGR